VTGAEGDESLGELANPSTAADGLIVDAHRRISLVVFQEPALVEGRREGRARPLQGDSVGRATAGGQARQGGDACRYQSPEAHGSTPARADGRRDRGARRWAGENMIVFWCRRGPPSPQPPMQSILHGSGSSKQYQGEDLTQSSQSGAQVPS